MSVTRTRYARLSELPPDAAARWLSADERHAYGTLRSPERRTTWLAGRFAAKRLLLEMLAEEGGEPQPVAADEIHIESRSSRFGHGERPLLYFRGRPMSYAISIAHTNRGVVVAANLCAEVALGVDLAPTSTSTRGSLNWTFTAAERRWLATTHAEQFQAERLWTMKEALYKACQCGEGFAPQNIEVVPGLPPRYPSFDSANLRQLQCWQVDGHIACLAIVKNVHKALPTNPANDMLRSAA